MFVAAVFRDLTPFASAAQTQQQPYFTLRDTIPPLLSPIMHPPRGWNTLSMVYKGPHSPGPKLLLLKYLSSGLKVAPIFICNALMHIFERNTDFYKEL